MSLTTLQTYIKDMNDAMERLDEEQIHSLFRKLNQLEKRFSKKLRSVSGGKKVYHQFIQFIRLDEANYLAARPYFREREDKYKDTINYAIDHSQPKMLHDVRINYQFCKFAIDCLKEAEKENQSLSDIFSEIISIRGQIINNYLPLSMHNAKRHKHPSSTIDFSDLIQSANEGLISAVDKYVMEEDGAAFHKVAIGRMVASMVNNSYLNFSVSIGPSANKKLYRIKRILEKLPEAKVEEIAKMVELSSNEVADLIAASSYMSLDKEFEGTELRMIDVMAHPVNELNDPYLVTENNDMMGKLTEFYQTLTIMEKKVLLLKGFESVISEVDL